MSATLQMTAFGLALLSTFFLLLATCTDCWEEEEEEEEEISHKCRGLWRECVTNMQDGVRTGGGGGGGGADHPEIVVTRTLLITADLLAGLALATLLLGLDCIKLGGGGGGGGVKMCYGAGGAPFPLGILGLVGSVWYAVDVYVERAMLVSHNRRRRRRRRSGWSCWLGMAGSGGGGGGGGVLTCCLY
ncbi:CLD16 protein, partial [Chunga burmeisteri]|nr:CLD16 protein [Chunga burmeisteri]